MQSLTKLLSKEFQRQKHRSTFIRVVNFDEFANCLHFVLNQGVFQLKTIDQGRTTQISWRAGNFFCSLFGHTTGQIAIFFTLLRVHLSRKHP